MSDIIAEAFRKLRDSVNCQLPCRVSEVNADGTVDVFVIRNDKVPDCVFPSVPIRHLESGRAYVFLGVKKGDRGVLRYFDRSVEAYQDGNEAYNNDDRQHSLSDGLFELGFIPKTEAYAYPTDKTIQIGNKNGSFTLSIAEDGQISITTQKDISITCKNASITGENVSVSASSSAVVQSPSIDLGGSGGQGVARIGDSVNLQTGKIVSGSESVRSL